MTDLIDNMAIDNELEELLQQWREEIAVTRRRARNWDGHLSDEYQLRGKATGLAIAMHDLEELIDEQSDDESERTDT